MFLSSRTRESGLFYDGAGKRVARAVAGARMITINLNRKPITRMGGGGGRGGREGDDWRQS